MSDVVVTVPKRLWAAWIAEGDLPGEDWSGTEYGFRLTGMPGAPKIEPGERVYIVAHGRLRGYAPLVRVEVEQPVAFSWSETRLWDCIFVRAGEAVACTIPELIRGFQGFRYRWWSRESEVPFPEWRRP